MKTNIKDLTKYIGAIVVIGGLLFYSSCQKDQGPFTVLPPITKANLLSFSDTIQPILTSSCAKAGCHVTNGQKPDLTTGNAYSSLTNGGYINTSSPAMSTIYQHLTGALVQMPPPPNPSDPSNINTLMLTWIQQGAKNN